jgi:hypothetical protein
MMKTRFGPYRAFGVLFVLELFVAVSGAAAQEAYGRGEKTFLLRPFVKSGWFQASLDAEEDSIDFVPNPMVNLGAKLGYKKLTATFSFRVARLEEEDFAGESNDFNLELTYPFRMVARDLVVTAFFHSQENLAVPTEEDDFYVIDGMDAVDGGIDIVLYLNESFSYKGVIDQAEPRSGNSRSWLARVSGGIMYLGFLQEDEERTFIPPERAAMVGELADLHLLKDVYVSAAGGYVYDWNFRPSMYLTILGTLGVTGSRLDLSYADGDTKNGWTLGPSLSLLLGFSYVRPAFHSGITINVAQESAQAGEILISGLRPTLMFFTGIRF